jgi:cytochrome c peroxidase
MRRKPLLAAFLSTSFALAQQPIFPPPPFPPGNQPTANKVLLGKALFWDEQLATTRSVACGSCHILGHGGADPRSATALHPGPDGVFATADDRHASPGVPSSLGNGVYSWVAGFGSGPQVTARTAPSIVNAAYLSKLFWDGRAEDGTFRDPVTNQVVLSSGAQLENLIKAPPVDIVEMGHPGRTWSDVTARVQVVLPLALASNLPGPLQTFVAGRTYPQLFQQAFGSPTVDASRIIMAIASYVRTLVSDQSPADLFFAGLGTLSPQATNGFFLVASHCRSCHIDAGPFAHATGPTSVDFRNTGVRPIAEDQGRAAITSDPGDAGRFKVPDLRNVALRGPFFHNGSRTTLAAVVDFYNAGGDFHVNQDPSVTAITGQLTASDRADIVAFLHALTDPRVQNELPPFDRPRLFAEGTNRIVHFGTGTPGTAGVAPRAIAVEPPRLGTASLTVAVDRAQPNGLACIAWDVAQAPAPIVVAGLTVHLALTPALNLFVAGVLQGNAGPGSGHASWSFAIPPLSSLQGLQLFGQWLVTDPAGPGGLATSSAFRLTLF